MKLAQTQTQAKAHAQENPSMNMCEISTRISTRKRNIFLSLVRMLMLMLISFVSPV